MSLTQFLVLAVVALVVTVPVVLLIPRARTSLAFDRLLWGATALVGFLAAWVAVAMAKDAHTWNAVLVGETPVLAAVIGALVAAFALNIPLWLADLLGGSKGEEIEDANSEDEMAAEEESQDQH